IQGDPRLQFGGASNDSTSFTVDSQGVAYQAGTTTTYSLPGYAVTAVQRLHKVGVTTVGQAINSFPSFAVAPGYPTKTDVAYYFVVIEQAKTSNSRIQQQF